MLSLHRFFTPLPLIFLTLSDSYAAMPEHICKGYAERSPKSYETLLKSGACKPVEGFEIEAERKGDPSKASKNWQDYTFRKGYCEGLGGSWYTSNDCMKLSKDNDIAYKKYAPKLIDREYDYLNKKWGEKSLDEICSTFGVSAFKGYQCYFSKGGLENNFKNTQVQFYLREHKERGKRQSSRMVADSKHEYSQLSISERDDKLMQDAGFQVDVTQKGIDWNKAKQLCTDRGLNLPSTKHLSKQYPHLIGYYAASDAGIPGLELNYFSSFVSDEIDGRAWITKNGELKMISGGNAATVLACVQLTAEEKAELTKQEQEERVLIAQLGTSSPLEFWQKITEFRDDDTLALVTKYAKGFSRITADGYAKFESTGNGWTLNSRFVIHDNKHEKTSNVFSWVFKADAGQRKQYEKRIAGQHSMKTYGLTQSGLKSVVANIQKESLYQALSDHGNKSDDYSLTLYGYFTDKKGTRHIVNYEIRATGTHVSIDYAWRR